jgi:hypothetical protein
MKVIDKKKPHLVDGERIFRQYERGELVTNCHILYPVGNDSTMIDVFHNTMQLYFIFFDGLACIESRKTNLTNFNSVSCVVNSEIAQNIFMLMFSTIKRYKTAKLDTFLNVTSFETLSCYWYNEHCKYKRTTLDHSHAFHK